MSKRMSVSERIDRVRNIPSRNVAVKKTTKKRKKRDSGNLENHPGYIIKEICVLNNISLTQLANLSALSYNHLYMLTRNTGPRNNMGLHAATKLEIATGIPVSYWMQEQSKFNRENYPGRYDRVMPISESEMVTPKI